MTALAAPNVESITATAMQRPPPVKQRSATSAATSFDFGYGLPLECSLPARAKLNWGAPPDQPAMFSASAEVLRFCRCQWHRPRLRAHWLNRLRQVYATEVGKIRRDIRAARQSS